MKVSKIVAVTFLTALGFAKASEWEEAKIKDRLRQVPDRFKENAIIAAAPGQVDLYEQLKALEAEEEIELSAGKEKEEVPASPTETKEHKTKVKAGKDQPKPKKEKPAKLEKKPEAEKAEAAPKKDSIRAKVAAALSPEWISEDDLAKKVGEDLLAVRRFCHWAKREDKGVEVQRTIQYRLKPAKK